MQQNDDDDAVAVAAVAAVAAVTAATICFFRISCIVFPPQINLSQD